jgi:NAD(P)-dependent dehydrogenase (short-subunit alcohol dehydrogenase family)
VAKAGGNVIIHYGSAQAAAYETKQAVEGLGVKAWTIQVDLEDPLATAELIEQAWNFSPLFGLINNAAVFEALTWQNTTIP